jgi:hypothetical protein
MRQHPKGIKVAGTVTSECHRLCTQILDRETGMVKFNGNIVVTS